MEATLDFHLESLECSNHLIDPLIHDPCQLSLLAPDCLPYLALLPAATGPPPLIFLMYSQAQPVEVPVLEFDLREVVLQVHRVVGLVRGRRREQAVAAQTTVTVQTVEVVLVVVNMALCLINSRRASSR